MKQLCLIDTGRDQGATFSPCRTWRYLLWRQWNPDLPTVLFVGLNPSTADETDNDPTITRCIDFAKRWGFGQYLMCNLFGYRSTDPNGMKLVDDPIGPDNDRHITTAAKRASLVIAAWGAHKGAEHRARAVLPMLGTIHCLRYTQGGHPEHPLYVPADTKPVEYYAPA